MFLCFFNTRFRKRECFDRKRVLLYRVYRVAARFRAFFRRHSLLRVLKRLTIG